MKKQNNKPPDNAYKPEPMQIGCGYCKHEQAGTCALNKLMKENRQAFLVNGFTTLRIAVNCKNFKHFNE